VTIVTIHPFLGAYFYFLQVDMAALKQMGESDLKDMGVPMVGGSVLPFYYLLCSAFYYLPC
jgi:hypothetical protein